LKTSPQDLARQLANPRSGANMLPLLQTTGRCRSGRSN